MASRARARALLLLPFTLPFVVRGGPHVELKEREGADWD